MRRSATPLGLRNALWLTGSLVLVTAPHAERMPWWLTLLVAVLVGWRLYLARARLPLPPRWMLFLVVIGATAGVFLHFGTIFGRDAGVALLVVMLTLKVLEMRTVRDGMLLVFLCYFLVITNFLYSQTIPTALYMFACVWMITASMIGLQYTHAPRSSVPQLRTAGLLLAQSIPLMLVMFVLFPRVQGPLWGMPSDAARSTSGLSDTMSPGSLAELSLSEAVAFRAVFKSRIPEASRLYWRGPVLWDFDGRTWHTPRAIFGRPYASPEGSGTPTEYTVTVEPHGKPWLFALDVPGQLPPRSMATADLQLLSLQPVTTRLRYDMVSYLDYRLDNENRGALERARRLPAEFNPRTRAFANELRARFPRDRDLLQAVLRHFNEGRYTYTLSPPTLGQHTADEFLFDSKAGFCEHYASSFAILMRSAGIPARIVTGYLGGEMNPIGDYLIVRQADAHAWTEVWLPGEGWVRVDPTAAVAPSRVEQGVSAAVANPATLPRFMTDLPVLRQLRLGWDSLANSWNQWVLGYTPERQRALLTRVGLDDATWRTLAALLLTITGALVLVLALVTMRRLRVRVRDPIKLAYLEFCEKLGTRGLPRAAAEGPLSFADRVSVARPDLAPRVRDFTGLYVDLRYARDADTRHVGRLQQLAKEFAP